MPQSSEVNTELSPEQIEQLKAIVAGEQSVPPLTDEEILELRKVAQFNKTATRTAKWLRNTLIFLASIVIAWSTIWDKIAEYMGWVGKGVP